MAKKKKKAGKKQITFTPRDVIEKIALDKCLTREPHPWIYRADMEFRIALTQEIGDSNLVGMVETKFGPIFIDNSLPPEEFVAFSSRGSSEMEIEEINPMDYLGGGYLYSSLRIVEMFAYHKSINKEEHPWIFYVDMSFWAELTKEINPALRNANRIHLISHVETKHGKVFVGSQALRKAIEKKGLAALE